MEGNSPFKSLSRRQEKNLLKAAEATARTDFENPERVGCPDSKTLNLLARRHSSVTESPDLIDHIGTCSPCFVEYSRYRSTHKSRVRIYYAFASIAVLVVSLAVARSLNTWIGQPAVKETARSQISERETDLVLDLRMKGASRSDSQDRRSDEPPFRLPRTKLSLSIQLPIGSEDGPYDLALVSAAGRSVLETRGVAKLQNFVEVLPVKLDLTDLAPGRYELRLRREQTPWSEYAVLLE